ncbi:MAG: sulfurtransferase complex subunit TusC [Pseudomonadales bacterium]|nr:sulfurtransferase complex subunit TusC [Pseudomonadales bacterium]
MNNPQIEKNLLFIFRQTPYGNERAKEGLDAALAAAAFDQKVSLLFAGDGLWQLCSHQEVSSTEKNHLKKLSACTLYGIENLYIYNEDPVFTDWISRICPLNCTVLDRHSVQNLISKHDHVLVY